MSQSQKLNLIYENIEVLVADNNYMVLPNETPIFFKALADARIISYDRLMVAWEILTFKHDEKNPFPSNQLLERAFNVGKRAMQNAVSEIVKTGLFINEKGKYGTDKRKNTYNVSPFLNLLGSFIEAFREGREVCIKELYKNVVSGNLKAKKVSSKQEAPKKEEKVVFSEAITNALDKLSEERRNALTNIVKKHIDRLDEETIIFYINRVDEKCNNESKFYSFASTCFKNASNGDKQKDEQTPKKESKTPYTGKQTPTRTEAIPDWFEDSQREQRERAEKHKALKDQFGDVIDLFEEEFGVTVYSEKEYLTNEEKIVAWYEERIKDYASREEMVKANEVAKQRQHEELLARIQRDFGKKEAK